MDDYIEDDIDADLNEYTVVDNPNDSVSNEEELTENDVDDLVMELCWTPEK